ncbi:MAG: response regulator transcription factor [Bryobacteraceae bacterium]|jgi:DNA-binding NarL/FixJ family response regulator
MMMPRTNIRVLLCNRHTLFREGIKALFLERTAIQVIGEAATARQTLSLMKRLRPDVVLLDATTRDLSCSEVTRRIKVIDPRVEILILSLYDDEVLVSGCLEAGAAGYIRKSDEPVQLRRAISTAASRRARWAA